MRGIFSYESIAREGKTMNASGETKGILANQFFFLLEKATDFLEFAPHATCHKSVGRGKISREAAATVGGPHSSSAPVPVVVAVVSYTATTTTKWVVVVGRF